eukprot:8304193-Ditylum_brightwellii.AAC.2
MNVMVGCKGPVKSSAWDVIPQDAPVSTMTGVDLGEDDTMLDRVPAKQITDQNQVVVWRMLMWEEHGVPDVHTKIVGLNEMKTWLRVSSDIYLLPNIVMGEAARECLKESLTEIQRKGTDQTMLNHMIPCRLAVGGWV